jgi:hypothetical protein
MIFIYQYLSTQITITCLSGGGWAEPKNGEAHFWARSWRCGVSEANTAKANYL